VKRGKGVVPAGDFINERICSSKAAKEKKRRKRDMEVLPGGANPDAGKSRKEIDCITDVPRVA